MKFTTSKNLHTRQHTAAAAAAVAGAAASAAAAAAAAADDDDDAATTVPRHPLSSEIASDKLKIKNTNHLIYLYRLNPKRHYIGVLDKICHYGLFLHQAKGPFYDESDIMT